MLSRLRTGSVPFVLTWFILPSCSPSAESLLQELPYRSVAEKAAILPGHTVAGTFDQDFLPNVHEFSLHQGESVSFSVSPRQDSGPMMLSIYHADRREGGWVWVRDAVGKVGTNGSAVLATNALAAGRYAVVVNSLTGAGAYELTWNLAETCNGKDDDGNGSTDELGVCWKSEAAPSGFFEQDEPLSLAVDRAGNSWALSARRILKRTPAGAWTWAGLMDSRENELGTRSGEVVLGADGTAHVFFLSGHSRVHHAQFAPEARLAGIAVFPEIVWAKDIFFIEAFDAGSTPSVLFVDDDEALKVLEKQGDAWTPRTLVEKAGDSLAWYHRIGAVSTPDGIALSYTAGEGFHPQQLALRLPNGRILPAPEKCTSDRGSGTQLAADGKGGFVLAGCAGDENTAIYRTNGTAPMTLQHSIAKSQLQGFTLLPDGRPVVCAKNQDSERLILAFEGKDGSWTVDSIVPQGEVSLDGCALAVDGEGRLHAMAGQSDGTFLYATRTILN